MIKVASFPQEILIEPDDPIYEINPCITSLIKDLPQAEQERIKACKGSRKVTQKRFNIANKGSKP